MSKVRLTPIALLALAAVCVVVAATACGHSHAVTVCEPTLTTEALAEDMAGSPRVAFLTAYWALTSEPDPCRAAVSVSALHTLDLQTGVSRSFDLPSSFGSGIAVTGTSLFIVGTVAAYLRGSTTSTALELVPMPSIVGEVVASGGVAAFTLPALDEVVVQPLTAPSVEIAVNGSPRSMLLSSGQLDVLSVAATSGLFTQFDLGGAHGPSVEVCSGSKIVATGGAFLVVCDAGSVDRIDRTSMVVSTMALPTPVANLTGFPSEDWGLYSVITDPSHNGQSTVVFTQGSGSVGVGISGGLSGDAWLRTDHSAFAFAGGWFRSVSRTGEITPMASLPFIPTGGPGRHAFVAMGDGNVLTADGSGFYTTNGLPFIRWYVVANSSGALAQPPIEIPTPPGLILPH